MTGCLRLKSLSDPVEPEDGTRILVTRYRPRWNDTWSEWHETVAPSRRLLGQARAIEQQQCPEAAWEFYVPRYVREMQEPAPQAAIAFFAERLRRGETITLLCFCRDEARCHRTLLRDLLLKAMREVSHA